MNTSVFLKGLDMRITKVFLLTASLVLLLASCRDSAMFNGPVGNYLSLAINAPVSGSSGSRVIHPDSAYITVSLTYTGQEPMTDTVSLDDLGNTNYIIDKLPPGRDVLLEVTMGLEDLPLCSASQTIDINVGSNTATIALAYDTYTVQGTLVDVDGNVVGNQVVEIDGTSVTTAADGSFSFDVSTEDWDEYAVFTVPVDPETEIYNFARNKQDLINSRDSFSLTVQGEVLIDINISCGDFSLEGANLYISTETGYEQIEAITVDANGDIFFQEVYGQGLGDPGSSHDVYVEYNSLFVPLTLFSEIGSPGAIIGDYTLDPYVIFVSYQNARYHLFAFDYSSASNMSFDLQTITGDPSFPVDTNFSDEGGRSFVDYKNGYIYLYISDDYIGQYLYKLDGFSTTVLDSLDVSSLPYYPSYNYSVQQMMLIENGSKLLVVGTPGAYTVSTSTFTMIDNWYDVDTTNNTIFVFNGAMEDSDGTLYAMGAEYDYLNDTPVDGTQKIVKLNSDGSISNTDTLPSSYNGFPDRTYTSGGRQLAAMIGLFSWEDRVISVLTQDTNFLEVGGQIIKMDNWDLSGSPISDSSNFNYFNPVGILPDNRFYIVNETTDSSLDQEVLRMNSANDSSVESKTFLTDPSGYAPMQYYFTDPSSMM
ncbi:MAG: hypothetical protein PQJ58_13105 [Spirochaetales bacterium]|nr:hypothetical protein [Spirochaetales bacterium]